MPKFNIAIVVILTSLSFHTIALSGQEEVPVDPLVITTVETVTNTLPEKTIT